MSTIVIRHFIFLSIIVSSIAFSRVGFCTNTFSKPVDVGFEFEFRSEAQEAVLEAVEIIKSAKFRLFEEKSTLKAPWKSSPLRYKPKENESYKEAFEREISNFEDIIEITLAGLELYLNDNWNKKTNDDETLMFNLSFIFNKILTFRTSLYCYRFLELEKWRGEFNKNIDNQTKPIAFWLPHPIKTRIFKQTIYKTILGRMHLDVLRAVDLVLGTLFPYISKAYVDPINLFVLTEKSLKFLHTQDPEDILSPMLSPDSVFYAIDQYRKNQAELDRSVSIKTLTHPDESKRKLAEKQIETRELLYPPTLERLPVFYNKITIKRNITPYVLAKLLIELGPYRKNQERYAISGIFDEGFYNYLLGLFKFSETDLQHVRKIYFSHKSLNLHSSTEVSAKEPAGTDKSSSEDVLNENKTYEPSEKLLLEDEDPVKALAKKELKNFYLEGEEESSEESTPIIEKEFKTPLLNTSLKKPLLSLSNKPAFKTLSAPTKEILAELKNSELSQFEINKDKKIVNFISALFDSKKTSSKVNNNRFWSDLETTYGRIWLRTSNVFMKLDNHYGNGSERSMVNHRGKRVVIHMPHPLKRITPKFVRRVRNIFEEFGWTPQDLGISNTD